jgi:HSP20 family protein
MRLREALPWNWGKKEVPVERDASAVVSAAPSLFDLFEDLRLRPFSLPTRSPFGFGEEGGFLPALDAKESDDEIRISVELPGLEEKDVKVSLKDDVLTIRGEKQRETKHEEGGAQWVERSFGSFRRAIPLPPDIEPGAVKAHFKAGVLTISAPRTGKPEPSQRSIPIRTE